MKKIVRVEKSRLERFNFESVGELKSSLESKHELRDRLSEDFEGVLREQNIIVDDAFKQRLHQQWKAQIQSDIRKTMDSLPESKKQYYSRITKGEPLKLRVKVDRTTGKHRKKIREEK